MPQLRPIIRRTLHIGAVSFASLLLLEVGLRIVDPFAVGEIVAREEFGHALFMPHPEYPDQQSTLRPGVVTEFLGDEYRIEANGMRSPQIPFEKAEGTYRVLVVGDSIAFGWGVEESECFPRVLERMLQAGPRPDGVERFEVINGGCPGWGLPHYLRFLADVGLQYDPDLVLVTFINNDLTDFIQSLSPAEPSPFLELPGWLQFSRLARTVKAAYDASQTDKGDFFIDLERSDVTDQAIDRACEMGFAAMRAVAQPRPLVVFDTVGDAEGNSLPRLIAGLQDLGIPRIEGFLPRTNYVRDYAITPTDMHPNARGHREFAEMIYAWFAANVLD